MSFRALEPEDLDWLMLLENDPSHWIVGERQLPLSRSTFKAYIENASETLQEAGQFRWVIELQESKTPVGLLDLYNYSERNHRAAVGVLVNLEHRNRGYAKEALLWLSNYAREVALLHQLYAEIQEDNANSIELFSSVGYSETGVLKDWLRRKNSFVNVVQMQLIL